MTPTPGAPNPHARKHIGALPPHSLLPAHEQQALKDAVALQDGEGIAQPGESLHRMRRLSEVTARLRFKYPKAFIPDEAIPAWQQAAISSQTR